MSPLRPPNRPAVTTNKTKPNCTQFLRKEVILVAIVTITRCAGFREMLDKRLTCGYRFAKYEFACVWICEIFACH